ncbi:DNA/RNA non-specific endonuclease [Nocardia sp. R7R-8]|uniref:DNA/RNA non-specific endonuclease n=1 Tax=Nocardia sp. R7R-8 TaxID=3459304 RepID=UPI00403D72EC
MVIHTTTTGRNEASWQVNSMGRSVRTSATIREVLANAERSSAEDKLTAQIGRSGGRSTDHGGHGLGHRFMKDQREKNMFPQDGNFNTSAYKKMENEWSDWVRKGAEVELEIGFFQADGKPVKGTERPERIDVQYIVRNDTCRKLYGNEISFENEPRRKFDRLTAREIEELLNREMEEIVEGARS